MYFFSSFYPFFRSSSPPLRLQKREFNNLPVVEEHNGHNGQGYQPGPPQAHQAGDHRRGGPPFQQQSPTHAPKPGPQGPYGQGGGGPYGPGGGGYQGPPQGYQPGPPLPPLNRPNSSAQQRYPPNNTTHGAYIPQGGQNNIPQGDPSVPPGPSSNRSQGSQGSDGSGQGMRGRAPPPLQRPGDPYRPASTVPQSNQDSVPGGIPGIQTDISSNRFILQYSYS